MDRKAENGGNARRRLDPDVRRNLILDAAARIVLSDGLTAISMERIAREAGVSKALVYRYFGNQTALLSGLLLREYRAFQKEARAAAQAVTGLEEVVRATTRAYLDHVAARGSLIQRLMTEPSIAAALKELETVNRPITAAFFAEQIAGERGVDVKTAALASQLLMGLTGAAGDYLAETAADPATLEPLVVAMIMASLDGLDRSVDPAVQ
jgi:TetR/AcrR family transcriptional regulator, fatty acid biosynthesis regulator